MKNKKEFNKIVDFNWTPKQQTKLRRKSEKMEYGGGWKPMSERGND
jgi:hypothetical protein